MLSCDCTLMSFWHSPHTTFPLWVTSPSSLMLTSITVPLVMTPSCVKVVDCGFFFTPMMGRQNVALSSGWVTCTFLNRNAIGRINLSNLGGFLVKLSPTYVTLVTILFHPFFFLFPVRMTLKTSSSPTAFTFGRGTVHLPCVRHKKSQSLSPYCTLHHKHTTPICTNTALNIPVYT